ncbi:MAG: hypothetical protein LH616_04720 [Ilumatobacteraceae bacterium]|nr:hypothetical protein [Ilumatobacteraceae bacterium]
MLDHLPNGLAPNIQAIAPTLRRAAHNLNHMPGVALILAGVIADTSLLGQPKPNA